MKRRSQWLIALSLAILGDVCSAADQGVYNEQGQVWCGFKGAITKQDIGTFAANAGKCLTLNISSPGGDVKAALDIGRIVRSRRIAVIVPEEGACSSSCVLVYAGGVMRVPWGPIQIHRPYLPTNSQSLEETQRQFDSLSETVAAYLRSMNVSAELYQMMMRVSPDNIRPLTLVEMNNLNMGELDPVYGEFLDSKSATRLGMSKSDFLRAKAKATSVCGPVNGILTPEQTDNLEQTRACWKRQFPGYIIFPAN